MINIMEPQYGIVMLTKPSVKENGHMARESLGSAIQCLVMFLPMTWLLTPPHWSRGGKTLYTAKAASYTKEVPGKKVLQLV